MSRPAEERCGSDAYWEAAQQRAPAFSTSSLCVVMPFR